MSDMKNWRKLRVVVEVAVQGNYSEKDLRWAVEKLLGGAKISTEQNRFPGKLVKMGTVHIKEGSRSIPQLHRILEQERAERLTVQLRDVQDRLRKAETKLSGHNQED